jgi:uncharacterized protein YecT (DUF1311 family)
MLMRYIVLSAVFLFPVIGQEYASCDALALKLYKARIDHSIEPVVERFDDRIGSQRIATVVWGRADYLGDAAASKATYVCLLETDKKAVAFLMAPLEFEPWSPMDPVPGCHKDAQGRGMFTACVEEKKQESEHAMGLQLSSRRKKLEAMEKEPARKGLVKALEDWQKSWIAYRDSTCAMKRAVVKDGSDIAAVEACVIQMNERRAEELKAP